MQRTKIEWVKNENGSQGYSINPVKGLCPIACKDKQGKEYCYARRMYKRFKWNPEIRFDDSVFFDLARIKPSRIFIGSTIELFGEWVKDEWLQFTFDICRAYSHHTFIFLTRQPQNLFKWSPFPDNCWVGVTAIDAQTLNSGLYHLWDVKAKIKFVSIEPLLFWNPLFSQIVFPHHLNWLIIGQQTPVSAKTQPEIEWIWEIVEAADKAGIPVFLKDNLEGLFDYPLPEWAEEQTTFLRQEFPK